jgi:hypothetical protein
MRARSILCAIVLAGCGSRPAPVAPGPPAPPVPVEPPAARRPAASVVTADAVCDRILELHAARCEAFAGYELDRAGCLADMRRWLDERGAEARQAIQNTGRCLLEHDGCDEVTTCIAALSPDKPEDKLRACADHDVYAAVGVPAAEWAQRKGAGAKHVSEASSSKEHPVEVCGIASELTWLTAVTCDDGSRPFANASEAHAARTSNVGAGGRCGSIIDLYDVRCPEGSYEVFLDAYVCPLP